MKTSDNLKLNNELNQEINKLIKLCKGKDLKKIFEILIKIDNSFKLSLKEKP